MPGFMRLCASLKISASIVAFRHNLLMKLLIALKNQRLFATLLALEIQPTGQTVAQR